MALCLLTAGASDQGRTFDAVATGFLSARITGQSSYRMSPDGELVIVLRASTPSPVAIVIIRESGDIPAAETSFSLVSDSCDNDPPSDTEVEQAGGFVVMVRGGPLASPEWAATAQAGTLTISRSEKGIAGRFDLSACGEHLETGERVELKLRGAFEAGGSE